VIWRRARKWKAERHVHGTAEGRDLDRSHAYIMIWRDHRIELAAHGAHENRVGGERPLDSSSTGRWREKHRVLAAESPAIARVRIQCAQRDPWLGHAEPLL